ncbi:ESPR-type extended signal peptide-containing protein, partial [uncultured Megasphaera sp.]|uniref:ESPR-type extended signal peptide-containing protein n=1 Tax=uncultured Megasphaera sp. TaxID=165188 RepID=UPI00288C520B
MNKIYKVIWSKVKHCYVVVSELTKRDGKSASPTGLLGRKAAVLAVMALCGAGAVLPTMPVRAEYVIAVDQTTVGNNGFAMKWPGADEKPEEYLGSIGVGYPKDSKNMQMRFGLATGDTDYSDNKKTYDGIPVANEYKYRTALGRQFRNFGAGATSIGYFSKSVGTETTSLGYMAQTEEWLGTALGARTYSSGKGATAVGYHAVSINTQSTAIGNNAVAFDQATAVGNDTWALGKGSIAFGSDDTYLGSEYMDALPRPVIESVYKKVWAKDEPYHIFKDYLDPNNKDDYGQNAFNKAYTGAASIYSPTYAGGTAAIAIGARAIAPGSGSTAVGVLAMAMGARSTAIGTRAYVSEGAAGGLSMGEESRVLQTNGISVGNHTYSGDQGSVSYGYNSKAVGSGAVAVGHQAVASAELNKDAATKLDALLQYRITKNHTQDIQTIMQSSKNDPEAALEKVNPKIATYNDASHIIRVKNVVKKDEKGNISWANPEHTVPNFNTSYEYMLKEKGKNAVSVGRNVWATGTGAVAVGSLSWAAGDNALALGEMAYAKGDNSLVLGRSGIAAAKNSLAIGVNSTALGLSATAMGVNTAATAEQSAAIGANASATASQAMALGVDAEADLANSIAIGVGSKTDYTEKDLTQDGWAPRNAITFPSSTQVGVVSVGSIGSERRISNVASGYRDTDAVNVSQLRSLEERFSNNLADDSDLNPFSYLAVDKTNGDVTKVIPLQQKELNYRKYINYRIKQIELQIKGKHQKIDKTFLDRIKVVVDKLEKNTANKTGIDASGLKGKSADVIIQELKKAYPELDTNDTNAVINKLNEWKKDKLKDSLQKALTEKEQGFLKETNYLNDGAKGKDAIAFGYKAQSLADNAVAIGKESRVDKEAQGAIALGAFSSGTRAGGQRAYDFDNERVFADDNAARQGIGGILANKSNIGALSIGSAKYTRQITNVAGGSEDTDAVNVAQLKRVFNMVKDELGFNFEPDWGGRPWVSVGRGKDKNNTLSFGIQGGIQNEAETVDGNIGVYGKSKTNTENNKNQYYIAKVQLAKNLKNLESATFTKTEKGVTTTSVINDKGLTIGTGNNAISLTNGGLAMGGQKITGLANGTQATDAVNLGQLQNVDNKVEGNIGFNIDGNTGAHGPWVSAGTKASQKGKISLKIRGGDNDSNINVDLGRVTNSGFDTIEAKINLNHNLQSLESATFTKDGRTSTLNQDGLTIGSGNSAVALTKDGLSMGSHQIHGVAAGKADTDAVNVAQVNKAIQAKADELKKNEIKTAQDTANTANTKADQISKDLVAHKKVAVTYDDEQKKQITLGSGTEGTTITHVKAGALSKTSTDAVNGSQLFATNTNVTANTTNISNITKTLSSGFKVKAGETEETVGLDNQNPETVEFKAVSENNSFTV